jgi:segregation and condensation protein A
MLTFRALTEGVADRLEVIVRFLAILELYKQGLVEIDQADTFGDLQVSWVPDPEPGNGAVYAGVDSYDG